MTPPSARRPELLAPAGDWDCARAAVANGADAVYFGLPRFNARMRADNFSAADLPELVAFLHGHGVKAYLALNVLIFPEEIADAVAELRLLNDTGVDAVIIQDVGLAVLAGRLFPGLRVHASTQMTVTSPEGVEFARELGVSQVVLSRELSLRDLAKFSMNVPLEVFVHGALCVAYSGRCLTSESLGRRSANRGECAQACRMPYAMIVDGEEVDLGDKRYLLSPQDLAAIDEIPQLIELGIASFKIEGRLKSPEYVAAVTAAYRHAIDDALAARPHHADRYPLEMTFSRGLFSGWMHGVDHQRLVRADFGKKRGVLVGTVAATHPDGFSIDPEPGTSLKPGDGVVVENPADTNDEEGGRIFAVDAHRLRFGRGALNARQIATGRKVWKTDDPALNARLRKSHASRIERTGNKPPLDLVFSGEPGSPLQVTGGGIAVQSEEQLEEASKHPLDVPALRDIFGRLSETPHAPGKIEVRFGGPVFLARSALVALRRRLLHAIEHNRRLQRTPAPVTWTDALDELIHSVPAQPALPGLRLSALVRTDDQLAAALEERVDRIYLDFEDVRRYAGAVALARSSGIEAWPATPRIQKAGEVGFLKLIAGAHPPGVLVRNVGAVRFFQNGGIRMTGDFSLNVSNAASAAVFLGMGLEAVTISYDLDAGQVVALLRSAPAAWFELTLHQHMPMFHMEHCVFAAFLSNGSTFLDCGRPCEKHRVHLRDRVGIEHPLRADAGCRNTLFNATAQTGATDFEAFRDAGLRQVRVELLEEAGSRSREILSAYSKLLRGLTDGSTLWKSLHAASQLGVTRGTLAGPPTAPLHP